MVLPLPFQFIIAMVVYTINELLARRMEYLLEDASRYACLQQQAVVSPRGSTRRAGDTDVRQLASCYWARVKRRSS